MHAFLRLAAAGVVPLALALTTTEARAAESGPCGNFDFSGGLACKIEVSGGCTASCTPFKVEVACGGKCNASATQQCTNDCGSQCVAQCDPKLMDCFAGCHTECDQPTIDQCQQKHPGEDCVTDARAQCDTRCKAACKVPSNNCEEHCNKCCTGSCTTQVNFDCDFSCRAEVRGSCQAHCQKPEGAIFCNGQYVDASDVAACVSYLATKGINVDVSASASGSAGCSGDGCSAGGSAKASAKAAGCAAAPGSSDGSSDGAAGALGIVALAAAVGLARRRVRRS